MMLASSQNFGQLLTYFLLTNHFTIDLASMAVSTLGPIIEEFLDIILFSTKLLTNIEGAPD